MNRVVLSRVDTSCKNEYMSLRASILFYSQKFADISQKQIEFLNQMKCSVLSDVVTSLVKKTTMSKCLPLQSYLKQSWG
jgi:hypothetical protein